MSCELSSQFFVLRISNLGSATPDSQHSNFVSTDSQFNFDCEPLWLRVRFDFGNFDYEPALLNGFACDCSKDSILVEFSTKVFILLSNSTIFALSFVLLALDPSSAIFGSSPPAGLPIDFA